MKLITIFFCLLLCTGPAGAAELPDNSVYQLASAWQTQNAESIEIGELGSHVQVVSFVYTYCEHTCPRILAKLQSIDHSLTPDLKEKTHITLISLDPTRDTPAVLKAYMQKHKLDETRWTMLQGGEETVRDLAAVLGTRYRPMGKDDIAHSNTLTVIGKDGVVIHQSKGVGEPVDQLIESIRTAVGTKGG